MFHRCFCLFQGMKVSCTHFQCAAWAFEYLRDHFGSSNLSVDMSHEVLTFQVHLMLVGISHWIQSYMYLISFTKILKFDHKYTEMFVT